jgi:hypothetical protein
MTRSDAREIKCLEQPGFFGSQRQILDRNSLADSSLRLQPDGREPRDYLVFPYPSKDPKWLWFGDRMLDGAIVRSTTP